MCLKPGVVFLKSGHDDKWYKKHVSVIWYKSRPFRTFCHYSATIDILKQRWNGIPYLWTQVPALCQNYSRSCREVALEFSTAYLVPFFWHTEKQQTMQSLPTAQFFIFYIHTQLYISALFSAATSCNMSLPSDINEWLSWVQGTTVNEIVIDYSSNKLITIKDFTFCEITVAALW